MIKEYADKDTNANVSIYVHIPFCVRKCSYCDFLSFPAGAEVQERYLSALLKEIGQSERRVVRSIFIGGGTPSLPDPSWIARILAAIMEQFDVLPDAEISMEMNPGTVTAAGLEIYKKAGINRISIGCQSMQDKELRALGRIHDAETFCRTFAEARKAGFANINVDLMSALPGQTLASYEDTLSKILALRPEHISAYSLILEEGTPFYEHYGDVSKRDLYDVEEELIAEGKVRNAAKDIARDIAQNAAKDTTQDTVQDTAKDIVQDITAFQEEQPEAVGWSPLPSEEEERRMYEETEEILQKHGYHRYEISNYARNDGNYECLHNKTYWERGNYLGFGIGAASLMDECRFSNTDSMEKYCRHFLEGSPEEIRENFESLSVNAQMEETMFLGLRECKGVSRPLFEQKFGRSIDSVYSKTLQMLAAEGLLETEGERVYLTERGIEVSNAVMAEFLL